MNTLAEFGTGSVFWSFIWFTMFFIWIWILIACFMDLFRDRDLGGGAKVLWMLFIIVFPYLGVFVYLIARGKGMQERQIAEMKARNEATQQYIQQVAGTGTSASEEIARLADLRDKGTITEEEFQSLKAKALA